MLLFCLFAKYVYISNHTAHDEPSLLRKVTITVILLTFHLFSPTKYLKKMHCSKKGQYMRPYSKQV